MPSCSEKNIAISATLATLASGQFVFMIHNIHTERHTHTDRRKGNQHTWQISSCHVIIAEMAVFNVAGYLIEDRRRGLQLLLPHEDNIPNKFIILKERHIQTRKPYQLPGWTKNSSYYIIVSRSGIELTTSRLHSFIMAKVSHSVMEAVSCMGSVIKV